MIIRKMTANFGCLNHAVLELEDGFNLFTLPNESGKSTWAAFLRVMLYGLNTRERSRAGFIADKVRYAPWNGTPMEGELICTYLGREICVRRYAKNGLPMGACAITWKDTGDPVPGLNGDNLGDVMLGVSREVFERTAFITQSNMAVTQTTGLEQRLVSVVSSGEESVSASEVRKRLREWTRNRGYRQKGRIPELEERRRHIVEELEAVSDLTARIRACRLELDQMETFRMNMEHQLELHLALEAGENARKAEEAGRKLAQAQERLARLQKQLPADGAMPERTRLEEAKEDLVYLKHLDMELKQAEQEAAEAREKLERLRAQAAAFPFSGTEEEVRAKARHTEEELAQRKEQSRKYGNCRILMPVLGIGLTLIGGALIAFLSGTNGFSPVMAAALLFAVAGMILGITFGRKAAQAEAEYKRALEAGGFADEAALKDTVEKYCAVLDEADCEESALRTLETGMEQKRVRRSDCWNAIVELVHSFAPEVREEIGFTAAISKALTLLDELERAETEIAHAEELVRMAGETPETEVPVSEEQPKVAKADAQKHLKTAQERIAALEQDLSMAKGQQSAKCEPEVLEAELERIDAELVVLRRDLRALEAASEVMEQAEAEVRNRFSPELSRRAGRYFERLTDGKYSKITLNRDFEAGTMEPGSVMPHSSLTLSQGTADQLWLAVRFALCDIAIPEENHCPMVLDDAMACFDDGRAELALRLLIEMSSEHQILMFTCHSREEQLLRNIRSDRARND